MSQKQRADAVTVAVGGSLVLVASLGDRALRLVVTWLLSTALGPEIFGSYTFAVTVATIVAAFGPIGMDRGAVYFGARYRQSESWAKLRGLLQSTLGISMGSAVVCAFLLYLCGPLISETHSSAISIAALGAGFWIPLLTLAGQLRAYKDMKGFALTNHILIPTVMSIGAVAVYVGWGGIELALHSFWLAIAISTTVAVVRMWPRFQNLKKLSIEPEQDFGALLRYSIPLCFTALLFRLNLWMDIIMLGVLSDSSEVGLYKIMSALAMLAGIPVSALITIFNPIISEHIERKALPELNELLKTVTRWLFVISIPIVLGMLLLTDLILWPFGTEYMAGEQALIILLLGQIVWIACTPAMRIVPMSGYSLLTLGNSAGAALINIGLNLWLIPKHGAIGAAIATATTLCAWSLWRIGETWWVSRCFPFNWRSIGLLCVSTTATMALLWFEIGNSLIQRMVYTVIILTLYFIYAWYRLLNSSDMDIGRLIKSKMIQKLTRTKADK